MAFKPFKILKGLLIKEENTNSPKQIEITPGGTSNTKTTILSSQTTDKTLTLPDATDTLVGKATTDVLTNKSIDADTNTITNIENADIKAAAAIDATKIADGSVDNTEFQQISGLTSPAVGTTQAQTLTNKTIVVANNTVTTAASGNLTSTELNAALAELQGDIDTNASGLSNHLSDTTDAHDASAISNVPSGNLVATDVQSALDELQTDVDTRANRTLSNLTSPTAINQTLLPDTNNTRNLGSASFKFADIYSDNIIFGKNYYVNDASSNNKGIFALTPSIVMPDGGNETVTTSISGAFPNSRVGIISPTDTTANAVATQEIVIATGNKTVGTGNTGDIKLRTGVSAGGTRGKIKLEDNSLSTSAVGYVWTLTNTTTGAGQWDSPAGLPTQTGNAGKVLGTNGTSASWVGPVGFYATKVGGDQNGSSGINTFSTAVQDTVSGFNASTGEYTIQTGHDGSYMFQIDVEWAAAQGVAFGIFKNGGLFGTYGPSSASSFYESKGQYIPDLVAGDIITFRSATGSNLSITVAAVSGFKVR